MPGQSAMSERWRRQAIWPVLLVLLLGTVTGCTDRPSAAEFVAREALMRSSGKMRVETAPPDVPFTADDLVRNFRKIAFFETRRGRVVPKTLTRWEEPIRYALIGSAVTGVDRREVAGLMARAAGLTGLDIRPDGRAPNFMIFVLTEAERRALAEDLERRSGPRIRRIFEEMAAFGWDCSVSALPAANGLSRIGEAIVFVRPEVTGRYRRACLHEEIFQGLGLFRDDRTVRPSIFNDDEEFALLTDHDALLVRILYHPRLAPGMTAGRAMPDVRRIVRDLMANEPAHETG